MSKKVIYITIAFMSIALLGVLLFQVVWFGNALELKDKLYEQNVLAAMQETVLEIENKEAARVINDKLVFVAATADENIPKEANHAEKSIKKEQPVSNKKDTFKYTIIRKTLSYTFDSTVEEELDNKKMLKLKSIKILDSNGYEIKQGKQTLIDSLLTAIMNGKAIPHASKQVFSYKYSTKKDTTIVHKNTEENARKKIEFVIDKLTKEFMQSKSNLAQRLPLDTLKNILSKNLWNKNIRDSFIFCLKTDSATKTSIDSSSQAIYQVPLFPHDINRNSMDLQLLIPNKEVHIIKSMRLHLFTSLAFTLFIVSAFAYSIYIMLKQKKLADIKNDFINNMTHEFKTPIATISLAVSAMEQQVLAENKALFLPYLGAIKEENMRMHKQVENVLQLALSSNKTFKPQLKICNVHDLIKETVHSFEVITSATKQYILLELNASQTLVAAEAFYLQQAIANVLDNALKYSYNGSKIALQTYNEGDLFILKIVDEGIGMKENEQKNIFKKFYRVQTGNIHNVKGFGIGLSYAQNIIQAHKGIITVQSELGKGTTFTIQLKTTI
jgi:two-component system phosphate regulon sensor histidine kinase PhoR